MNKSLLSTELIIRAATVADIPLIQDIVTRTWPATYTSILGEQQVNYMIDKFYCTAPLIKQMKNQHYFFLAFKENHHIGFASFSCLNEKTYKLQKLYVVPGEQKTGAGKVLLQTVETGVKNMGAVKLQLNVNRKNNAKIFYEKNGFVIISVVDIDIENGYFMNDYFMEKDLYKFIKENNG